MAKEIEEKGGETQCFTCDSKIEGEEAAKCRHRFCKGCEEKG